MYPLFLDDRLWHFAGHEGFFSDLLGLLAGDAIGIEQVEQVCGGGWSKRVVLDGDGMRLEQARDIIEHQVAGCFGSGVTVRRGRGRYHLLKVVTQRFIFGEDVGILCGKSIVAHITSAARIGQFWQERAQFLDPGRVDQQWREIRLREVAIVVRLFFAALRYGDALCLNPAARLLRDRLSSA